MIKSRVATYRTDIDWTPAPPESWYGRVWAVVPWLVCWCVLLTASAGSVAILCRELVAPLDAFTPLAGHFLGFGLAAAAALWLGRRHFIILVSGSLATVYAHALPSLVPVPFEATQTARAATIAPRQSLKVMAFNVWSANRNPQAAVAAIAGSAADVVLLSEIEPWLRPSIKKLHQLYPFQSACISKQPCKEVVLSRRPLVRSGKMIAGAQWPGIAWAEIALDEAVVTVVAVHVHRPTANWRRHVNQMSGLIGFLQGLNTPVIVGGDLNVTTASVQFERLRHDAALSHWSRSLPTWPAVGPLPPQFGIDHVLVSGELEIEAAGVAEAAGSDHRPIWSRIAFRPRPEPRSPVVRLLDDGGT